jgi:ABC-type polysaccharide/polyol phosphate export permease
VIQGMFFLSPVIYSLNAIPERFRGLAYLNWLPYTLNYHTIIFERNLPGMRYVLGMVFISGLSLFLGIKVFNKLKEGFADIL